MQVNEETVSLGECTLFKTCSKCRNTKDVNSFYRHKGRKDGLDNMCKTCKKKQIHESHNNLKSYLVTLARTEGISTSTVCNLWHIQQGICAITHYPMTHVPTSTKEAIYNASIVYTDERNPILVCAQVKQMKKGLTMGQLIQFCNAIVSSS